MPRCYFLPLFAAAALAGSMSLHEYYGTFKLKVEHMANITYRKLVKVGNSCFIAIPKPWLLWANVQPGDKLRVTTDGKVIIERQKGTGATGS